MNNTTRRATTDSWMVVVTLLVICVTPLTASAELPQAGDLVFGHSDFDAPETLELVRGPRSANGGQMVPDPWDATVPSIDPGVTSAPIQSVELDNLGGIPHNVRGNLLGVNFGSSTFGGEIYSLATAIDPAPAPQSIGHTQDLDFGPTRLGGLSVSPNNTRIAVTGYDSQRLIVYDYTPGNSMGAGAALSNGRESAVIYEPTDTQGSAWLNNNTVLAFHSAGDLYEVNATTMAHTLVKDLDSPILGGEVTSLAYEPSVSKYIYASKSSFASSTTTNTLFILDPTNNYELVKQLNLSTSLSNTAREIALDQQGNLFISVFGGDVEVIPDVVTNPAALTDNAPIVWYESTIPSGFNGIDVGFGEAVVDGVPGDYNDNGTVDAADYVLWRNGGPLENEGDNPGVVNQADYDFWRAKFGATTGAGALSGAVPEPAGILLSIAALVGATIIRLRQYRYR